MAGGRWALLVAVGAVALGAVGCGGDDKPTGTNVALVTPGARDDVDWTRQTTTGVEAAARKLHLRAVVADGSKGAVKPTLRRLERGAQLVVVPGAADRDAAVQAAQASKVPTLVWGDPKALRAGLVGDVEADLPQGAYAAGALAAKAAFSRNVGIVLCDDGTMPMTDRFEIAAAYIAGARSAVPDAKASYVIAGSDAGSAKTATLELVKRKAQMILGICGTAVEGVVDGVEEAIKTAGETQFVGLVGDKSTLNKQNVVLTSAVVNPAVAVEQALRDIRAGHFGKRAYRLDMTNGGITLLQTGRTPADAYQIAEQLKETIGSVKLPPASDVEDLDALIKG